VATAVEFSYWMFAVVCDTAVVGDVGKFHTKRCVSGARPPPVGGVRL